MKRERPLRVLIVEDEALLALDLEMMIRDSGHIVVGETCSLREVERLRDETAPDLAFVDLHLAHGSSGLDVSACLTRRWRQTIVVFVTANSSKIPDDFAGAHGHIKKPFSRNGLMRAMRYLGEGILDPPPKAALPSSLIAAPGLAAMWG